MQRRARLPEKEGRFAIQVSTRWETTERSLRRNGAFVMRGPSSDSQYKRAQATDFQQLENPPQILKISSKKAIC